MNSYDLQAGPPNKFSRSNTHHLPVNTRDKVMCFIYRITSTKPQFYNCKFLLVTENSSFLVGLLDMGSNCNIY